MMEYRQRAQQGEQQGTSGLTTIRDPSPVRRAQETLSFLRWQNLPAYHAQLVLFERDPEAVLSQAKAGREREALREVYQSEVKQERQRLAWEREAPQREKQAWHAARQQRLEEQRQEQRQAKLTATRERRQGERQANEAKGPQVKAERAKQRASQQPTRTPTKLAQQLLPFLEGTTRRELERAQKFLNNFTTQTRSEVLKLIVHRHPLEVEHLLYGLSGDQMETLLRSATQAKQDLGLLTKSEPAKAATVTPLTKPKAERSKAPEQPNPEAVNAAVQDIVQLSHLGGASGGAITAHLHGLSPAVRAAVLGQLQHAHPQTWAKLKPSLGSVASQDHSAKLSPYDYAERVCELLDHPSPERGIIALIETAQRHGKAGQVADAYRRMFGHDLAEALGSALKTASTRQHVFALLQLKTAKTGPLDTLKVWGQKVNAALSFDMQGALVNKLKASGYGELAESLSGSWRPDVQGVNTVKGLAHILDQFKDERGQFSKASVTRGAKRFGEDLLSLNDISVLKTGHNLEGQKGNRFDALAGVGLTLGTLGVGKAAKLGEEGASLAAKESAGLTTRGYRPQPGERAATREGWHAERRARYQYDAKTRSAAQLRDDALGKPRTGETPAQRARRVQAAEAEVTQREQHALYQLLGDRPPKIRIAKNDASHAAAHTLERHGPDVPLRRSDASLGKRTIEGRIYGDPPWPRAEKYSYKWHDPGTMDRVVEQYLQENWEAIRAELAADETYTRTFDVGQAVGEGFFRSGSNAAPRAVYGQTSLVTVTIEITPGQSATPFIITVFPNGRGY